MVSQAELISRDYHSLVPGLISIFFRDGMGPFKKHEQAFKDRGKKHEKTLYYIKLFTVLFNANLPRPDL